MKVPRPVDAFTGTFTEKIEGESDGESESPLSLTCKDKLEPTIVMENVPVMGRELVAVNWVSSNAMFASSSETEEFERSISCMPPINFEEFESEGKEVYCTLGAVKERYRFETAPEKPRESGEEEVIEVWFS